ncbi:hypothetical protein [Methylobacterium sp. JK268]
MIAPLSLADRLECNAILDRLVADEPTFAEDDARRLIRLLPLRPRRRLSLNLDLMLPGSTSRGYAAGHGDVALDEEGVRKSWSTDAVPHKIGGYEVTHEPGVITIKLMWAETRLDLTSQSCQLLYDRLTGRPREMRLARQVSFRLLIIQFAYVRYEPWKLPGPGVFGA